MRYWQDLHLAENRGKRNRRKRFCFIFGSSIALLGQTLREWHTFAKERLNAVCICSDEKVSQKRKKREDQDGYTVENLALPASTDVNQVLHQFKGFAKNPPKGMTVVFSTYHSIEVISKAQKKLLADPEIPFGEFDLVICDEAQIGRASCRERV